MHSDKSAIAQMENVVQRVQIKMYEIDSHFKLTDGSVSNPNNVKMLLKEVLNDLDSLKSNLIPFLND